MTLASYHKSYIVLDVQKGKETERQNAVHQSSFQKHFPVSNETVRTYFRRKHDRFLWDERCDATM